MLPRRCLVPLPARSTRSSNGAASLGHTPAEPPRDGDMAPVLDTHRRLFARRLGALATAAVMTASACRRQPAISDENYKQAVVAFYTGLAALETSQEVLARRHLERVTTLAPHEPAAWADIGLLLLRQQELDAAAERLTKAAELAPEEGAIQRLLGLTESRRGNLAEAIATGSARWAAARRCQGRIRAGAGSRATGQPRNAAGGAAHARGPGGTHR